MKNLKNSYLVLILLALFASCQKTPTANFDTDKALYIAGETIKLTNRSLNGSTYIWTLPDGSTVSTENYDYKTNDQAPSGKLTIKLEAKSRNGKKTDSIFKLVNIQEANSTGDLVFWEKPNAPFISVQVEGVTSNITTKFNEAPDCGASGCAVFNEIEQGTYYYHAATPFGMLSGSVVITKGTCTKVELIW